MIPRSDDIRIEASTNCRYNCFICPHNKMKRKHENMSLTLFTQCLNNVLKTTKQYTSVTFAGMGEPMMDPTLLDKMAICRDHDMKINLLTNAYFLTEKNFAEMQRAGLKSIRISMYGTDDATYSKMHGANHFGAVQRTIETIAKEATIPVILTLNVVSGINEDIMFDWIKRWQLKVSLLEVWRPHNWVYGRVFREVQEQKVKTCGRPTSGPLQIQVDGTVNMCCFDYDGLLTLGDLKWEPLGDIFESKLYKKILECHRTGDFEGSGLVCAQCDQRNADKSKVMLYSSRENIMERVGKTSSTYQQLT